MNVYDEAHSLARAIKESNEFVMKSYPYDYIYTLDSERDDILLFSILRGLYAPRYNKVTIRLSVLVNFMFFDELIIPEEDINQDASYLGMEADEFIDRYLKYNSAECTYETKKCPCDFWDSKTGECLLGDCKPESCKKYPYTDQPDRIGSLLSIIDNASICPVVYEILERLKEEYHFRKRAAKNIP